MTRLGHPRTHGHHIDRLTCGSSWHAACTGFSGPLETYVCGCCCHDLKTDPQSVTEADHAWIKRVTARPAQQSAPPTRR